MLKLLIDENLDQRILRGVQLHVPQPHVANLDGAGD
jgi:hypothetical protein